MTAQGQPNNLNRMSDAVGKGIIGQQKVSGNLNTLFAVALFACGFPAAEILLESWGAIALIAARNTLAFLFLLLAWPFFEQWQSILRAPWLKGLTIGALGFGTGSALLLVTQTMTNTVTASLAAASMPVVAIALEVLLDGRRLTGHFILGVCLVLIGGVFATGVDLRDASFGVGILLGLLATALFAWGSRATVKNLPDVTQYTQVVVTTAGMVAFAVLAYAILRIYSDSLTQAATLDLRAWGVLLVYAWVALAISQTLWISGVNKLGIGIASFHLNAAPFYVMLILVAMGGTWSWLQAFGAAILAAGVVVAQRK